MRGGKDRFGGNVQKKLMGVAVALACLAMVAIAGCGGGGGPSAGNAGGGGSPSGGGNAYTVSGTLSGLSPGESVTLDADGNMLTLNANGAFAFSQSLPDITPYTVEVQTQPPGEMCAVSNGVGNGGTNVTNVGVSCAPSSDTVLYSFNLDMFNVPSTADGIKPQARLLRDSSGNLYGVTLYGGTYNVEFLGDGALFKVSPTGTETLLHSFAGGTADGKYPAGPLVMDSAGNPYGTTNGGGANGDGTVFEFSATGTETLLYSFAGGTTDGVGPQAGLIMDSAGNFYGTTAGGGANGDGTVFKLTASGTETVLYSFTGGSDGATPIAALIMDSAGNLYGTTQKGGASGNGTVFKISAAGRESVLYAFGSGSDGQYPDASLVRDNAGSLYGTTPHGGVFGDGTVFKLTAGGAESVLYNFTGGTADGRFPDGGLVMDDAGNLYGTTAADGAYGSGTAFEVTASGTEVIVHSFGRGTDGQGPIAGLILDDAGNLYGTTQEGGGNAGNGTVFEISAAAVTAAYSTVGSAGYVVGGTISGLVSGAVVNLLNDGTESLTLQSNGGFQFPTRLASGSAYDVTIASYTAGAPCTLSNATGTIVSSNVIDIVVSCATPTFTVGGTVSGLTAGESVTLLDNGGDALTINSNGPFTFATKVAQSNHYDVTVQPPPGVDCPIANQSGTIDWLNVTNITVSCNSPEVLLYSFSGTDGQSPDAGLVMDSAGNFYGTTKYGGTNGDGTVFKLSANGTETVLHSFAGGFGDGANPAAPLIMDSAGNLYGTTVRGGPSDNGTVFEVSASGSESVLYYFAGGTADGANPYAAVVRDASGNLYGTTPDGGASGFGTVFEVAAGGTERVLHSFAGGTADGAGPDAALIMDSSGNFYGTTSSGGADAKGTVYELSAGGTESILYSFTGGTGDGETPYSGLVMDSTGDLYGTTSSGGAHSNGVVFKLSAGGTESVLYSFGSGSDAGFPESDLILDSAGNLYGATLGGGQFGAGAVFELAADGTESILHSFDTTYGSDPGPQRLVMDSAGHLYGTAESGGANSDGVVFEVH